MGVLGEDLLVDVDALGGDAVLSAVDEHSAQGHLRGVVQVSVFQHCTHQFN
jgi:hypothetical protein